MVCIYVSSFSVVRVIHSLDSFVHSSSVFFIAFSVKASRHVCAPSRRSFLKNSSVTCEELWSCSHVTGIRI